MTQELYTPAANLLTAGGVIAVTTPALDMEELFADETTLQLTRFMYPSGSSSLTGSGAVAGTTRGIALATGTTVSSIARRIGDTQVGFDRGTARNKIPWNKKVIFSFRMALIALINANSNGILEVGLGKDPADTAQAPTVAGIGFVFTSLLGATQVALGGDAHDGSSRDFNSLGTNIDIRKVYDFTIVSSGDGTVEYFLDGVSLGSFSGGPSTLGNADASAHWIEIRNQASAENYQARVHHWDVIVEN